MSPGVFRYTPLADLESQIRLLRLQPGADEDGIACDMQVYGVAEAPEYRAISYTWGDELPLAQIRVNGEAMMVRANCAYVLWQAQLHSDEDALIWIDGICINQQDLDEKASQVAMMGDIYQNAALVLSSLGRETPDTRLVFDASAKLRILEEAEALEQRPSPLRLLYNTTAREANLTGSGQERTALKLAKDMMSKLDTGRFEQVQDAYVAFSNAPYWGRLWIVQEVALAKKVLIMCGLNSSDFDTLALISDLFNPGHASHTWDAPVSEADDLFSRAGFMLQQQFERIVAIRRDGHFDTNVPGLWYQLVKLKCFDPRDRIYGLLKLIKWPAASGPPKPDYRRPRMDLAIEVIRRLRGSMGWLENAYTLLAALDITTENVEEESRIFREQRASILRNMDHGVPREYEAACTCRMPCPPAVSWVGFRNDNYGFVHVDTDGQPYLGLQVENSASHGVHIEMHEKDDHWLAVGSEANGAELRLITAVAVQIGDVVLQLEFQLPGRSFDRYTRWPRRRSCLLLRRTANAYYQIVSRAIVEGPSEFWDAQGIRCSAPAHTCPCRREGIAHGFSLCVNADDALDYFLAGLQDDARDKVSQAGTLSYGSFGPVQRPFVHRAFSSYAMVGRPSPSTGPAPTLHLEVNGVPSNDGKSIVCATCGGLFIPDLGDSL